jgi:hypothetical protein
MSLAEACALIERLAHRLIDWTDFRIWELHETGPRLFYRTGEGLLAEAIPAGAEGARLRTLALESSQPVIIIDGTRDTRIDDPRPNARSRLVAPLRFGVRHVGILELDHHKRATYGAKQVALVLKVAISSRPFTSTSSDSLCSTPSANGAQVETLGRRPRLCVAAGASRTHRERDLSSHCRGGRAVGP